jgi:RNA polymerase sigma-70 factor (ECF subfamily)
MTDARHSQATELLEHVGWLRSLARGLVADTHAADDVVQQTLLAALEHPPRAQVPLRSWLAAVARNFVREDRRSQLRRSEREARAARSEACAGPDRASEQIELARLLLTELDALGEPWRSVVVARYLEGEPPRVIAARMGVPLKTVKNRLARALELLRERLDRRHGGERSAWLVVLTPLARSSIPTGLLIGSVLVNTQAKLVAASIALLCALVLVWRIGGSQVERAADPLLSRAPAVLAGGDEAASADPTSPTSERIPATTVEVAAPAQATPPAVPPEVRGRVIDIDGRAIAGISIVALPIWREPVARPAAQDTGSAPLERLATSGADGRFEIARRPDAQALGASEPGWTTVFAASNRRFEANDLVVVIAPSIAVAGVVVDDSKAPIAGPVVSFRCDAGLGRRLALDPEGVYEVPRSVTADEQGRFAFADIPAVGGSSFHARAPGFKDGTRAAPLLADADVEIVLVPSGNPVLRGEVRDEAGQTVEGAWVALRFESAGGDGASHWGSSGNATACTDREGKFAIDATQGGPVMSVSASARGSARPEKQVPASKDVQVLLAAAPGFLPARAVRPESGWPDFVTLELGGPALEIHGRVVDQAGVPIANARVWTIDESSFGSIWDPLYGPSTGGLDHSLESVIRGQSRGAGSTGTVRSDEHGTFVLNGLSARAYRLGCVEDTSLRNAVSAPFDGGELDARLVLEEESMCARVAGRIVSPKGEPIEGVTVSAGRPIARWPWIEYPQPLLTANAKTDARGHFAFERIATKDLALMFLGDSIWTAGYWRAPEGARLDDLQIRVRRRCEIQIDLGDRADLADAFGALTETGAVIQILWWQGSISYSRPTFPIEKGSSEILFVPEDARTIVLSKTGTDVLRVPILPEPGKLSSVRP